MCAKFHQIVSRMLPEGPVKEGLRSSYYRLYYNPTHLKENDFHVYYRHGHFEYNFDGGVTFSSYQKIADELKRSLKGYLARHDLREGQTVIDCGACTGEFALYAAVVVGPIGRVIAFEPDPALYNKLLANIELNGLNNITAVNKGVWSSDGVLKFVDKDVEGHSFVSAESDKDAIEASVASLDNELARLGIAKVDFIKMDVEAAEIEAIKGAEETLRQGGVDLAIASYHLIDGRKSCFELERMLTALGYSVETSYPRHLTTYGRKIGGDKS